jgi:hypothetical protein
MLTPDEPFIRNPHYRSRTTPNKQANNRAGTPGVCRSTPLKGEEEHEYRCEAEDSADPV